MSGKLNEKEITVTTAQIKSRPIYLGAAHLTVLITIY